MRPIIQVINLWRELWARSSYDPGYLTVDQTNELELFMVQHGMEPMFGTTRCAVRDGDWVIKLPKNIEGVQANHYEAGLRGKKWAKCRLMGDVLVMEYVELHTEPVNKLPSWCWWIDCCQVGYNRRGQLVAYDYG